MDNAALSSATNTLSAVVTVVQNDIDVYVSKDSSSFYFYVDNNFTASNWSSKWYVDGTRINENND